ncbi:HET domain-containing protein [Colletotrichum kahawae]|uniref:HET domain-containing protein n=1 Tax=Colletotrichum kahawae TaxID=34407 RepID=A0AAD9XYG9_COLKA|nr:HET domain-containing protein [Colletotrichum kahawae]
MRVLDTTSFKLHSGDEAKFREEGYAILSHRWGASEITFKEIENHDEELKNGAPPLRPPLEKIRGACSSSVEEAESINSMFKWYCNAKLCIVYLQDVKKDDNIPTTDCKIFNQIGEDKPSEWFYRGWMLQETLAPSDMEFYDTNWAYFGTKTDLKNALERITGIPERYLTGLKDFRKAPIAAKMSWMAGRNTAKEEDIAYSMVGLFGLTMTIQYGEGYRAYLRLQEILLTSERMDESIFAWKMPNENAGNDYNGEVESWTPGDWGLLAPSPNWFKNSGNLIVKKSETRRFAKTGRGVEGPFVMHFLTSGISTAYYGGVGVGTLLGILPGIVAYICVRQTISKRINGDLAFRLSCYEKNDKGKLKPL